MMWTPFASPRATAANCSSQQHADARIRHRADPRDQALQDHRSETQRELVDEHELRLRDQRLREDEHLLLASGEQAPFNAAARLQLGEELEGVAEPGLGVCS